MNEDLINFELPVNRSSIIKVIGVGGGGSNAVNHMSEQGIKDVDFVVCNTDSQAIINSPVQVKVQLGESLTEGRGAGNKPDIGKQAAIESMNEIVDILSGNTKMVFITAGMGGGTGTGAAPVIAKAAKEMGILTVAIVTIPFRFEGKMRLNQAIEGIRDIQENVDSLLIINNEKLREIYGDLKLSEAFTKADNVLTSAAKGIAEIITVHGYINVDFADVQTVMTNSGVAIMGSGTAGGEDRSIRALQEALASPLLNNNDIKGAQNLLLNITSGVDEISMDEVGEITDYLGFEIGTDVNIIWGTGTDESLGDKVNVTVIATGFEANSIHELLSKPPVKKAVELREETKEDKPVNDELVFEVHNKLQDNTVAETQLLKEKSVDKPSADSEKYVLFEDEYPSNQSIESDPFNEDISNIKEIHRKQTEKKFQKLSANEEIDFLENEPAFKRKNVKIKDKIYSTESEVSKYTLTDEENEVVIRKNNSFLHDNVD